MGLSVPVNVAYDSDPDRVERVLLDGVGRAIGEVPGLLADPAPLVPFDPGFGDYALGFSVICNVAEFTDQYLVQHELRKRIFKRIGAERIAIPFPTRTLYVQDRTQTGRQS
jgi:small-conductance mechanosensitive channel